MRTSYFIVALVLVTISQATVVPRVGPIDAYVANVYKVQIDDEPLKRWEPIMKDYKTRIHRFIEFLDLLPIPKGFYDGLEWFARNEYKHQDFVKEVDAISKLAELPFEKVFFLNYMYQISTIKACTAVVARNSDGKIVHGRNMDFEMFELIGKLMATVEYWKGDTKVYTAETVVGSAFALTGIRHGKFAVNIDTRRDGPDLVENLVTLLKKNYFPTAWLLRKVLEEEDSYETAVQRLKTEKIDSPVYYIISGLKGNEGMVIEREPLKPKAFYQLTEETWFLVQTNYDRDEAEPWDDKRRHQAEERLKERGNKNFQAQNMMDQIMFKYPTFNIGTIMTAVMVPASDYRNNTVWYGNNPTFSPSQELRSE